MTLTQEQMDRITAYRAERDAKNAEWMATLTPSQVEIVQQELEEGSDLETIREFVIDYGFEHLTNGNWALWGELNDNYHGTVIQAYVDEFGIDTLSNFSDTYLGKFMHAEDFVTFMLDERGVTLPAFVAIDYDATADMLFSEGYTELCGYYFAPQ